MKIRNGFVSNSSSSSFIVAIKKGYSWEQLIEDSGPMKDFAKDLFDWLAKKCPQLQSVDNLAMYKASQDYSNPEDALEAVQEGEYDWTVNNIKKMFENPDEWMVGQGWASYNEGNGPVEYYLGWGGEIDSENFKLKGFGN